MRRRGYGGLVAVILVAGCAPAWRGTVRDSLVTRGPVGWINVTHRPLREAAAWVQFPVWAPEGLPEDVDVKTFRGVVDPAGSDRLFKSGRVYVEFEKPASFTIWEMAQPEWDNGGAPFAISTGCRGKRVALPSAAEDACLGQKEIGSAWINWQTTDGVHILIMAWPDHGAKKWSPDALLLVARSMVRVR